MDSILSALDRAAEGAFLIDNNQRIIHWNRAAQEMLGYAPAEVLGHSCHEIIQGRDDHDRAWCRNNCYVTAMARAGQPVETFNTIARTKAGELRWINISILALQTPGDADSQVVMHLFRDATELKLQERFTRQVVDLVEGLWQQPQTYAPAVRTDDWVEKLTDRELDVLRMLAQGYSMDQIAQLLSISKATARNHTQSIYQKLGVHNRAQAVAYAYDQNLVPRT